MRVLPGLIVVGVALTAACSGSPRAEHGTTTLPPGATIVPRPTEPPHYPRHRLGFPYGTYVMARPLATRGPGTGRTYALDAPVQRRALALARSLGFGDAPLAFGAGPWTVVRGQAGLRIWPDSGGRWRYERQRQTTGDAPEGPGERRARRLTGPILRAAGLDPALARAEHNGLTRVLLEPRIEGHPTWGWETEILLDGHGVSSATGWLGPPRGGAGRRLLSQRQAFTLLQRQAARPPEPACPAAHGARTPPCPARNQAPMVTGARLAYALDWGQEGHRPRLVPAWLFSRRGTGDPVAYPA